MKKSIIISVLVIALALVLSACTPGQLSNLEDDRPKVAIFDSPSDLQLGGLKKVLYSALSANDAALPYNVLSPVSTDYFETNGSINSAQAEYYGSIATRRTGSKLGVFLYAPVLERSIYTEKPKQRDDDGFQDASKEKRLVVSKLRVEAFILDPVSEERLVTYTSHLYESQRLESLSHELVDIQQDPDIWKMANLALREFAPSVAQKLNTHFN